MLDEVAKAANVIGQSAAGCSCGAADRDPRAVELAMLESLTVDTFRPHVGSTFRLVATEALTLDATLAEAQALGPQGPGAARAPFKLLFHAPLRPILPQRIYRMEHDAIGVLDLFIVPIGPAGDRMQYEAIFT